MKKIILFWVGIQLIFVPLAGAAKKKGSPSLKVTTSISSNHGNYAEIPIYIRNNHTVVKAKYKGKTGNWIVDTGWISNYSGIDKSFQKGVSSLGTYSTRDMGKHTGGNVTKLSGLHFLGKDKHKVAAIKRMDVVGVAEGSLLGHTGIFGFELLKNFVVKLDYGCKRILTLYKPQYFNKHKSKLTKGFSSADSKVNRDGSFVVNTKINGISAGNFIFDTGSFNIFLNSNVASSVKASLKDRDGSVKSGFGGDYTKLKQYKNVEVEFGGVKQKKKVGVIPPGFNPLGSSTGDLGYTAVEDLIIILDYPSGNMYVKKAPPFKFSSTWSAKKCVFKPNVWEKSVMGAIGALVVLGAAAFAVKKLLEDVPEIKKNLEVLDDDGIPTDGIEKAQTKKEYWERINAKVYDSVCEPIADRYNFDLNRDEFVKAEPLEVLSKFRDEVAKLIVERLGLDPGEYSSVLSKKIDWNLSTNEWSLKINLEDGDPLPDALVEKFKEQGIESGFLDPEKLSEGGIGSDFGGFGNSGGFSPEVAKLSETEKKIAEIIKSGSSNLQDGTSLTEEIKQWRTEENSNKKYTELPKGSDGKSSSGYYDSATDSIITELPEGTSSDDIDTIPTYTDPAESGDPVSSVGTGETALV
jgi:hypothetical protein